jgi:MoaA/NifB/PqqE/SkfB family radical SAM enzyme
MLITKPGPWRITFDTNPDDCNLRCIMCEGFSPHSTVNADRVAAGAPRRRMSIDLIRQILEDAKGSPLREIIPSTMGEPLLYKHFEEIIGLCHEYQIKLNLTTNGTFPRKSAEEWSKLLVPITSDVKFSWNGATKETQEKIMIGSRWEKVLENVKTFIKIRDTHAAEGGNRSRVTLQLTFLETNVNELPEIVKLGIDLGVDRIKGHHLWAHFKEIKNLSMRRNSEAIQRWNEAVRRVFEVVKNHLLPNGKPILLENIGLLDEDAVIDIDPEAVCPFLGKEAWVNTEGRFSPCCAPDKERQTLGEFGNLHDTTLEGIWQSESYQNLRKTYKNHNLCIGCNMRKPMTEDLMAS